MRDRLIRDVLAVACKPGSTYHHGDLRDALIKAALREAERGGAEAISIKALAKQLGVSQPAPYRHFADREALLAAVTAEAFRQLSAVLREAMAKSSKQSKLSRLAQAKGRRLGLRLQQFHQFLDGAIRRRHDRAAGGIGNQGRRCRDAELGQRNDVAIAQVL